MVEAAKASGEDAEEDLEDHHRKFAEKRDTQTAHPYADSGTSTNVASLQLLM